MAMELSATSPLKSDDTIKLNSCVGGWAARWDKLEGRWRQRRRRQWCYRWRYLVVEVTRGQLIHLIKLVGRDLLRLRTPASTTL